MLIKDNQPMNVITLNIKQLFEEWNDGCKVAESQLINYFYPQIKKIAKNQFKHKHANALQTTEIVSEAFIKFQGLDSFRVEHENQFLALCSKIIRSLVVDHYREQLMLKRGGGQADLTIDRMVDLLDENQQSNVDWIVIDELLSNLEKFDSLSSRIVELKVFTGLTIPEVADVLAVSESKVSRDWKVARLWMLNQLKN